MNAGLAEQPCYEEVTCAILVPEWVQIADQSNYHPPTSRHGNSVLTPQIVELVSTHHQEYLDLSYLAFRPFQIVDLVHCTEFSTKNWNVLCVDNYTCNLQLQIITVFIGTNNILFAQVANMQTIHSCSTLLAGNSSFFYLKICTQVLFSYVSSLSCILDSSNLHN